MKLNKNGWSIVTELVVLLIAIVLLVFVIFGLNKLGLIRNMNEALGVDVLPELVISGKKISYESVETELINASKDYVYDKYGENLLEDEIRIETSQLIKNSYISTIRDSNNKECTGYVIVKNAEVKSYRAYLKCSKYTTPGY